MASRLRFVPDPPPRFPPLPEWVRQSVTDTIPENALFAAGAALAALHPIACADHPIGRLWRQRLALASAAALVRHGGRSEDAATLRDHCYLTAAGDDPGPAGRLLAAWRALGEPLVLAERGVAGAARGAVRHRRRRAARGTRRGRGERPERQGERCCRGGVGGRRLPAAGAGPSAAGAVARRCRARRAAELAGAGAVAGRRAQARRFPPCGRNDEAAWRTVCALAWSRAASNGGRSLSRSGAPSRQADCRRAETAWQGCGRDGGYPLSEDAQAARPGRVASDRSSRRLFDRLVSLGAVRELTGRPTFRLYGL